MDSSVAHGNQHVRRSNTLPHTVNIQHQPVSRYLTIALFRRKMFSVKRLGSVVTRFVMCFLSRPSPLEAVNQPALESWLSNLLVCKGLERVRYFFL